MNTRKKALIIGVQLAIALIHILRIGQYLPESSKQMYYGYASDILLPFGFYFLLVLCEISYPLLHRWYMKSLAIFGLAALAEILQGMGVYVLGNVFDPIDFGAYAAGVLLAALVDRQLFARLFRFWNRRLPG